MWVELGNNSAVEGYRDPNGDNPEQVLFREAPGERVTGVVFPDDVNLQEAFTTVVNIEGSHFQEGTKPAWVLSDSAGLQALLAEHYGLDNTGRPAGWGQDTGISVQHLPSSLAATSEENK